MLHSVAPISVESIPVIATISPTPASSIEVHSSPTLVNSSFTLPCFFSNFSLLETRTMGFPTFTSPLEIFPIKYLPKCSLYSILVICIWKGLFKSPFGAGRFVIISSRIGVKSPSVVSGTVKSPVGISLNTFPSLEMP